MPSALRACVLEKGLVSREDLEALEQWPAYKGVSLAERLYRSGLLSDTRLLEAFAGMGAVDGTALLMGKQPAPAALGALSRALADRHRAVPLKIERSRLVLGMLDPSDTQAIEKITFFCGLAVEPRAIRPRALFQALQDAYGIALVVPEAAFLASRADGALPLPSDSGEQLPAPMPNMPVRHFVRDEDVHAPADVTRSPLARGLARAAGFADDDVRTGETGAHSLAAFLKDTRPARAQAIADERLDEIRRSLPPGSPLEARDSLPPQVLRVLVPPFRCAVLFLVRGDVAVGWDGRTPARGRDEVRDVLLPLTAPSALERAWREMRVAAADAVDPTTTERLLFRAIGVPAPASFVVVPIVVGDATCALLYADRGDEPIDDRLVEGARRVGHTLADGLAPFVAAGTLFPPVRPETLHPITAVTRLKALRGG